jgi:hypothetical protein
MTDKIVRKLTSHSVQVAAVVQAAAADTQVLVHLRVAADMQALVHLQVAADIQVLAQVVLLQVNPVMRVLAQVNQVTVNRVVPVAQVVRLLHIMAQALVTAAVGVPDTTVATDTDGTQVTAVTTITLVGARATVGIGVITHVGGTQVPHSQFGSGTSTLHEHTGSAWPSTKQAQKQNRTSVTLLSKTKLRSTHSKLAVAAQLATSRQATANFVNQTS